MVFDPIPQPLPVHFFGSRPQPPTSPYLRHSICSLESHSDVRCKCRNVSSSKVLIAQRCVACAMKGLFFFNWLIAPPENPEDSQQYSWLFLEKMIWHFWILYCTSKYQAGTNAVQHAQFSNPLGMGHVCMYVCYVDRHMCACVYIHLSLFVSDCIPGIYIIRVFSYEYVCSKW